MNHEDDEYLNDEYDIICRIKDLKNFRDFVRKNSYDYILETDDVYLPDDEVYDLLLQSKVTGYELSDAEIEAEINKYLLVNDYDNERIYYILKMDLKELLQSLGTKLTIILLNKLVDKGKLHLCWDEQINDFTWYKRE